MLIQRLSDNDYVFEQILPHLNDYSVSYLSAFLFMYFLMIEEEEFMH